MRRVLEPEVMDDAAEVAAYAEADFRASNAQFVQAVLREFETEEPLTIYDIGCGPGEITIAVARARPDWAVVGIDASQPMLAIARARAQEAGATNVRFEVGDANHFRLPSAPGLAIISNSLLHHLPEPAGFWESITHSFRIGSPVFIRDLRRPASEADARAIVERHAAEASSLLKEEFYRSLLAAFTPEEVEAQAEAAGLCTFVVEAVDDRYLQVSGFVG